MANQSLPVMILDLARHAMPYYKRKEKHAMFIFYLYFCYNDFKHGFVIVFYLFQCQNKTLNCSNKNINKLNWCSIKFVLFYI